MGERLPEHGSGAGTRRLRSAGERVIQTLCFEAGGLLIVTPMYALLAGESARESFLLIALLSLVVMGWSAVFNTVFDIAEHHLSGRVASDRPRRWRVVHAALHEVSAVVVTWPVIVAVTGLAWGAALVADLGLTLFYAVYAYGFHRAYDAWRPVAACPAS